jgi:hypothetical protein
VELHTLVSFGTAHEFCFVIRFSDTCAGLYQSVRRKGFGGSDLGKGCSTI